MRVDHVETAVPEEIEKSPGGAQDDKRQQDKFPERAGKVGRCGVFVGETLPRGRRIAEAADLRSVKFPLPQAHVGGDEDRKFMPALPQFHRRFVKPGGDVVRVPARERGGDETDVHFI